MLLERLRRWLRHTWLARVPLLFRSTWLKDLLWPERSTRNHPQRFPRARPILEALETVLAPQPLVAASAPFLLVGLAANGLPLPAQPPAAPVPSPSSPALPQQHIELSPAQALTLFSAWQQASLPAAVPSDSVSSQAPQEQTSVIDTFQKEGGKLLSQDEEAPAPFHARQAEAPAGANLTGASGGGIADTHTPEVRPHSGTGDPGVSPPPPEIDRPALDSFLGSPIAGNGTAAPAAVPTQPVLAPAASPTPSAAHEVKHASPQNTQGPPTGTPLAAVQQGAGQATPAFVPNTGITDSRALYVSEHMGLTGFLTTSGVTFEVPVTSQGQQGYDVFRLELLGANRTPAVVAGDPLPAVSNYFTGSDASAWHVGLPNYSSVTYKDIYSGIDLTFRPDSSGKFEYAFTAHPGADTSQIHIGWDGVTTSSIDSRTANLLLTTPGGQVTENAPTAYAMTGTAPTAVAVQQVINPQDDTLTFSVGAHDPNATLVLDPSISYSEYLGGSGSDYAYGVVTGLNGSTWVAGSTSSSNFPTTTGVFQGSLGGSTNCFIARFNADGTEGWASFLGGSASDAAYAVAVDAAGNVFLAGAGVSSNFPKVNAIAGQSYGTGSGFAAELNASGTALIYATPIGTVSGSLYGIAIDPNDAAYVTGVSGAGFTTTTGAFQTSIGSGAYAAVLSKVHPGGGSFDYSTYVGGNLSTYGFSVQTDAAGDAFLQAATYSTTIPTTTGAYQRSYPGSTSVPANYVAELNPAGSAEVFATYVGPVSVSLNTPCQMGLALDSTGAVYVSGGAQPAGASNYPVTAGSFGSATTGLYATKLNATGTALVYSGVVNAGYATAVSIDLSGDAFLTGNTFGGLPVSATAFQSTYGGAGDAFLLEINPAGTTVTYGSYLGGNALDVGTAVSTNALGATTVVGYTSSLNFPTYNPAAGQGSNSGGVDAFLSSFLPVPPAPKITGLTPDTGVSSTDNITTATTISLLGTAVPNATVTLYREGLGLLGSVTASSGGTWTYNYTSTQLPEGVTGFYATQSNAAGTSAPSADFLATVDLTPPTVTASVPASTYSLGPVVTVRGADLNTLPNGTTVTLDLSNGTTTTLGYATGTLTDGQVNVKLPQLAATGTYTLDARVTDLAGNQATSASATFNVSNNPTPWSVTSYQKGYLPDPTGNALELIGDATTQHPLDLDSSPGTSQSGSTGLVYHSDWVNNHPLVQLSISTPTNAPLPTSIVATLIFNSVTQTAVTYSAMPAGAVPGDTLTLTLQDSTLITSTWRYPWSVQLQVNTSGGPNNQTINGDQIVIVEDNSPFGSGWTLGGFDQLVPMPGDAYSPPGVLRIYGSGGGRFYSGGPIFTSPAGDPGLLVQNGGSYTYTLPDGQVWSFGGQYNGIISEMQWQSGDGTEKLIYNSVSGQINSITAIDGSTSSISYSGGLAQTINEPNGRTVSLSYSLGGTDLVKITSPDGGLHTFTYGGGNHLLTGESLVGSLTLSHGWSYNGGGLVSGVGWGTTSSTGVTPQWSIGLGALSIAPVVASVTDADSHTSQEQLDWRGRALWSRAADGGLTAYGWSVSNSDNAYVTTVTDPIGRTTTYARDSYGYVTQLTYPDGNTEQMAYQAAFSPGFHAMTQFTDANGNPTSYAFDSLGHQTSMTDALGNTTTQSWSNGLLQSQTDANHHTTSYNYDSSRRLTSTVDAQNNTVSLSYDLNGNVSTSTDALGHTTTYLNDVMGRTTVQIDALGNRTTSTYDLSGLLVWVKDALGHLTSYSYGTDQRGLAWAVFRGGGQQVATDQSSYDGNGWLVGSRDPNGYPTQYKYDPLGRVTQTINAAGGVARSVYDLAGQLTTGLDELGRLTLYSYNLRGWQTQVTDPARSPSSTSYDKVGNVLTQTDALGHVTSMAYDKLNRTTLVTDHLGHTTSTAFDPVGNVTATTNQNGNQTTMAYDSLNRQTATTAGAGTSVAQTSTTGYDNAGNVTSQTDGLGHTTTFALDALYRVTQTTDSLNHSSSAGYDGVGNQTTSTDALGNVTTFSYDGLDRRTLVQAPLGVTSATIYDLSGNAVRTADALGVMTSYAFDGLNRQTAVNLPTGAITQTGYDPVSNARTVIDSVNNQTNYVYDNLNREIKFTDPNGNSGTMAYDAASRLTAQTDRLGRTILYGYDNADRKTQETWKAANGTVVNTQSWSYDNNGNTLTASDNTGTITQAFDVLNRLTSKTDVFGLTVTLGYDNANRRTSATDSLGGVVTSVYDNGDRLTSRQLSGNSMQLRVDAAYDAGDRLTTLTHYGTTGTTMVVGTTSQLYDQVGRVTAITNYQGAGPTVVLSHYNDSYDKDNRLTGETWGSGSSSGTHTYTYDLVNQLLSADGANYGYDLNGNRNMTGYQTGKNNQLSSDGTYTYTYDNEGNLIQKVSTSATWTYGWDNLNRLVSVKQVTTTGTQLQVTYVYDIFNNRVEEDKWKASTGTTVTLRHGYDDHGNIWADVSSTNTLQARYVYGDGTNQVWARAIPSGLTNAGVAFYLTDHLGSARDLMDSNGVIQDHIEYDGYGNATHTTVAVADGRGFAGGEYDYDTKQEHFGARYYDPATGRWTTQDPMGFGAGDANLYRYVGNDATNAVDPTGTIGVFIDGYAYEQGDNTIIGAIYAAYPGKENIDKLYYSPNAGNLEVIMDDAVRRIKRMRSKNAAEPVDIMGWSRGAMAGIAIANKLAEAGIEVRFLGLIDPCYPLKQVERIEVRKLAEGAIQKNVKATAILTRDPSSDTNAADAVIFGPPRVPSTAQVETATVVLGDARRPALDHLQTGFTRTFGQKLWQSALNAGVPLPPTEDSIFWAPGRKWRSRPRGGTQARIAEMYEADKEFWNRQLPRKPTVSPLKVYGIPPDPLGD
jgi:RHS repeat-associated protein